MGRNLDVVTLDNAARDWAAQFTMPSVFSKKNPDVAINGREWTMQNLYNMHFKDEHEHMLEKIKRQLGPDPLAEFEALVTERLTPRSEEVFAELLAEKLAITVDGDHIEGRVGTVILGARPVGQRLTRHGMALAEWPIYAGEEEERTTGRVRTASEDGPGVDPLPNTQMFYNETDHLGLPSVHLALNTNVSIAFAQAGVDAALDLLDEGTVDGVIQGRTGSQPVDPNAATTGTNLFSLDLGTPAFGASTDAAPGALGTAAAIADDVSADATGTLGYCRASSANTLIVPLNSHIDGEAGVSGADFNFNTVAIVSGAVVSMTSWAVTQPQGPTAT